MYRQITKDRIGQSAMYKPEVMHGHQWHEYIKMSYGYLVYKVHTDGSITEYDRFYTKSLAVGYCRRLNNRLTRETVEFMLGFMSDAARYLPKKFCR